MDFNLGELWFEVDAYDPRSTEPQRWEFTLRHEDAWHGVWRCKVPSQERLGHGNIGITLDTYSHVLPGLQEAAALTLDERLSRARTESVG